MSQGRYQCAAGQLGRFAGRVPLVAIKSAPAGELHQQLEALLWAQDWHSVAAAWQQDASTLLLLLLLLMPAEATLCTSCMTRGRIPVRTAADAFLQNQQCAPAA